MAEPTECSTGEQVFDLNHHGDHDQIPGLLDFAVNIHAPRPPDWVVEKVMANSASWARYPDASAVSKLMASQYGLADNQVLATSGAAEASSLIAAGLDASRWAVVHPQFTEPEAALLRAGHQVQRLVLKPGFELANLEVPADVEVLFVGNPTNPTGVLHPVEQLKALVKPGRVLVVDEAFMDFCADLETMISPDAMRGVLVVRSLTKIFSVPGLRAGFVAGDADLISKLAAKQPPWSVSQPAVDVIEAAVSDQARKYIAQVAAQLPARRADLVAKLTALGLPVVAGAAPFVLVNTSSIDDKESLRPKLAQLGIGVRRCETFPGLGKTWLRLAVRVPSDHDRLIAALKTLQEQKEDNAS